MTLASRNLLLGGASLVAFSMPTLVSAQTTETETAVSSADSRPLEEIVVTAQRRAQNLQDVPIAVTAISGETAVKIGITGTENLRLAAPGLDFSRSAGNGAATFLRGVGSTTVLAGAESPVALYIDDVYVSAFAANLMQFNGIEQVAVLKGPQGTLFGRNATGGVIQIYTKKPTQKPELDASIGYGNLDTRDASLYVSGGLAPDLAANFSFTGHDQDNGFGRNLTTGDSIYKDWNWGARGSLLWTPGTDTEVRLSADYGKYYSELGVNGTVNPGTVSSGLGTFGGRYTAMGNIVDYSRGRQYGVSLKIEHSFDLVKLVSISAYRHVNYFFQIDQDGGPRPTSLTLTTSFTNTWSQELQLQSQNGDRFNWIAGVFYFKAKAGFNPVRAVSATGVGAAAFNDLNDTQTLNSYSGFGEINYEILSDTTVTAGIRYTADKYDFTVRRTDALGAPIAGGTFEQAKNFSKLTYRGILSHKFTPDIMAYASYSRGFKSGGFNTGAPGNAPGAPPVSPEVLDAVEVGFKSELFDRTLRLNVAAFHYDYKNLQVTVLGPASSLTVNAASARIKGLDLDATFAPTSRLQFTAAASFLDGKYKEFPNGPMNIPRPAVCTPVPMSTGAPTGGNLACAGDLSGNTTVRTPKFTGNVGVQYTMPTTAGDFSLATNLYHNSGFYWDPDNRTRQVRHNLLNASLTWRSESGHYEVSLWGKNLLDDYYIVTGNSSASRFSQSPGLPRTYGVSLGVHF